MQPLYPPEYQYRPDAPLLSFGPAFSEDLARAVVRAIWHENHEQPHETDVRTAAGLTMLEAFHPRDQVECMIAAQGVATHCAIMDNFRVAADPDTPPLLVLKFRTNAVSLGRFFSNNIRDITYLQSRPLPPRPGRPPDPPTPSGDGGDAPPDPAPVAPPRARRSRAKAAPAKAACPTAESPDPLPDQPIPPAEPLVPLEDIPEIPEDIETRPDGTPGNLTAYMPKAPIVPYIPPREAPIMVALATRPKPWRMVNVPKDQAATGDAAGSNPPPAALPEPQHQMTRGPVDMRERIFTGDALARFAATRFDPDAPAEPREFERDDSMMELELISTGGDPVAEAHQAAMMAAHPEGKPIVTLHHGSRPPSGVPRTDAPPSNVKAEPPPDG